MRPLSLVRLKEDVREKYTVLFKDDTFIYFGEVAQMPDHCVIVGRVSGKMYSGFHTENFEEIPQDEV